MGAVAGMGESHPVRIDAHGCRGQVDGEWVMAGLQCRLRLVSRASWMLARMSTHCWRSSIFSAGDPGHIHEILDEARHLREAWSEFSRIRAA